MGTNPAYEQSAKSLGAALAKSSRPLIYGGGKMGIMGVVSQAVLDNGGHVTGVSPYAMVARGGEGSKTNTANGTAGFEDKISSREAAPHPNRVSIVVGSMHERKTELAKLADGGFVALPGGYGTFEEVSCAGDHSMSKDLNHISAAPGSHDVVPVGHSCEAYYHRQCPQLLWVIAGANY